MATANPARGQLGFEVDGVTYILAFTTNALCAVEDEFDLKDIRELENVLSNSPSLRTIRTLFRLGLVDCHPEANDREAGLLIDAVGGLEPALELIMRAMEQAFPEAAKTGTADPRQGARQSVRGTGSTSKRRGAKLGAIPSNSGA